MANYSKKKKKKKKKTNKISLILSEVMFQFATCLGRLVHLRMRVYETRWGPFICLMSNDISMNSSVASEFRGKRSSWATVATGLDTFLQDKITSQTHMAANATKSQIENANQIYLSSGIVQRCRCYKKMTIISRCT